MLSISIECLNYFYYIFIYKYSITLCLNFIVFLSSWSLVTRWSKLSLELWQLCQQNILVNLSFKYSSRRRPYAEIHLASFRQPDYFKSQHPVQSSSLDSLSASLCTHVVPLPPSPGSKARGPHSALSPSVESLYFSSKLLISSEIESNSRLRILNMIRPRELPRSKVGTAWVL